MSPQDLMRKAIEELGDPDELANNEDLIILKLEPAFTNKWTLPDDIKLSDDARRLSMGQRAFITHRALLGNLRYSGALFAGCRAFSSLRPLLETAKYVLKNVRSLVLVHNRNQIIDLITWFPTVNTVILYHNLRWNFDNDLMINEGSTKSCRMEQLLGNTPAMGSENLNLRSDTLVNLLKRCPRLAVVMSTNMEAALSSDAVVKAASKRLPVPFRRKELFLGSTFTHHTGILLVISTTSAEELEEAHRHFGEVEHLDLTAESESAIGKVASYTKVTHLSLVASLPKDKCSFEPHVTEVLSALRLVHLSLKRFCGVKLSVIANLCPHLKFLGISMCDVDGEEDVAADFPNLEHLRLGCAMKDESFFKLLRSCPGLRELDLEWDELTTAFVVGPPESYGERPRLEHVERLTLRTNCDVESGLDTRRDLPSDLDLTLACVPSLQRVRSDSYEIRTEEKVESEREAGPTTAIIGFESWKGEKPVSAEKPENRQQLHEAGEPHQRSV
ncbi:hypothetical protein HPB52_005046 [Rhipicephalus sanguineus]|uniref:Uncharacterized protein n=1 Tax=Rhipicephalus sanguineus TaxID=34632 RepID=A0A9D4T5A9_RHISA|nr:hypothetical protein HPB52_005046 [Rhipicephalus sanguineus]